MKTRRLAYCSDTEDEDKLSELDLDILHSEEEANGENKNTEIL
jgi:hypothetical protein